MSTGHEEANGGTGSRVLSAADLADKTRFKFREHEIEVPELDGNLVLRSLTVAERESLPDPAELEELDDEGERTEKAMEATAKVFSIIVAEPKVSFEQARDFIPTWPAEALDRVTAAYRLFVGNKEEVTAAGAEFPAG